MSLQINEHSQIASYLWLKTSLNLMKTQDSALDRMYQDMRGVWQAFTGFYYKGNSCRSNARSVNQTSAMAITASDPPVSTNLGYDQDWRIR